MHTPSHFKNENLDQVKSFLKINSFPTLYSSKAARRILNEDLSYGVGGKYEKGSNYLGGDLQRGPYNRVRLLQIIRF